MLGAVVLLALPGVLLLGLSLLGHENAVNGWLRRHVGLSYHNPLPAWAAVLLALVPPLLVLLYFLKLRRKAVEVPSTVLWRQSIEDLRVNSLFQWLRDSVLLLAQLAVVLLLIYSALAFQVHGQAVAGGRHYILLIDNSASMAVSDAGTSRLEVARTAALAEIDARPDGDTGMVIEFNARAAILQPYTHDRGLLRAAVRRIRQTQRPTRLDEALALADGLANPSRTADDELVRPAGEDPAKARTYVAAEGVAADVHLYSDGRFPDLPGFAAGNLSVHYHRIGVPGAQAVDNVALVSCSAVRDDRDPARLQVFARLLNFRPVVAEVTVELECRHGGRADFTLRERRLRLPARVVEPGDTPGEGAVTFDLDDVDESSEAVLHLRLKNHRDAMPLDDEAWLVAGVVRKARVLIVTPGNAVLRTFFDLDETARVAQVRYLTPADLTDAARYTRPARNGEFDLVIFDRCAPPTADALPRANTFFVGDVPPPLTRQGLPPLRGAVIRNPTSPHPLMRHLSGLDEIAFGEAFRVDLRDPRLPPRIPRLLETDRETAVLFVVPRGAYQDLVLAFPLVNDRGEWTTSWNLQLSFPVFLRNVLYLLGNVSDAAAEETVQPGQVKRLRPDRAVPRIEVADPAGMTRTEAAGPGGEFAYPATDRVGVYRAAWTGGGRAFAVNLLDAEESNPQPRDTVRLGDQRVAADRPRQKTYDTWKWAAAAALAFLVLEWAVHHRRAWF
ncbi:MAG: VWA domain-containing protein [Gemmataceae bacterium]